ncbi:MAG: thiamine-phosphate kinase [Pseudomonadales bacterium]|nr:thiamine-phosphate kinase [Pseudomonadales bacterium]
MDEFELIDQIVAELGAVSSGDDVILGPGDDASVLRPPPGEVLVSSIDALVAGVHFPAAADPELVGYRALMVSLSDLAAMGASPAQVLVALTLSDGDVDWVRGLARGMRRAAESAGVKLPGGNIARGPLNITVSVNGFCPEAMLLRRAGARAGDHIYVSGELGGAAAALGRGGLEKYNGSASLDKLASRYFQPEARLGAGMALRGVAHSAIDVSDGLLQDLGHLCRASAVGAELDSTLVPVCAGATLEQALTGGDDYELLFTAPATIPALGFSVHRIGTIVPGAGVRVDGKETGQRGYRHFG